MTIAERVTKAITETPATSLWGVSSGYLCFGDKQIARMDNRVAELIAEAMNEIGHYRSIARRIDKDAANG